MRWAAEFTKISREERMKPGLKRHTLFGSMEGARPSWRRFRRLRSLNLSLALLITATITPYTEVLTSSRSPSGMAFAESDETDAGAKVDKRPVRVAPDGTEIVDYISELEQSNDALEQQIRSLKEQLVRQNSGSIEAQGRSASNSLKERDLIIVNPRHAQLDAPLQANKVEYNEKPRISTESIDDSKRIGLEKQMPDGAGIAQGESDFKNVVSAPQIGRDNQINKGVDVFDSQRDRQPEVSDMAQPKDSQRYIAPVLPVIIDQELNSATKDDANKKDDSGVRDDSTSQQAVSLESGSDGSTSYENAHQVQVRARLSNEKRQAPPSLNYKDDFRRDDTGADLEAELSQDAAFEQKAPQQPGLNRRTDAPYVEEQDQELQAISRGDEASFENGSHDHIVRSIQDTQHRVLSNDPAIIDAKRRVRTDVSTLVSLIATREQLFRRYGSQGGQIQISPSRLVTQRGETFESIRGRQETAITVRDLKQIEADLAELRKVAEKDISFIRRYARSNPMAFLKGP